MKLQPAEGPSLQRVLDESHAIWSDGLSRLNYGRFNAAQMLTPWGRRNLHRVVLLDGDGAVLSSAKRYSFSAHLDGQPMKVVGIGAVFTPAAGRGRGYARAIVEEIVQAAHRDGADLALLFSEIEPDYYAAMGFAAVPRHEVTLETMEKPGAPAVLVRSGEERDIAAVADLSRFMAGSHRFALAQEDDLVRFGLSKKRLLAGFLEPHLLNVEFFIVEEGISAAAFGIITVTSEDVILEMCGDRDPSGARVGAMLQVLRARYPAERAPRLSGFLPPGWCPPQVKITAKRLVREVMMVRPLREGVLTRPLEEQDVLYWHGDLF